MCLASAMTARITCSMRRMARPSLRLRLRNTSTISSHSVGLSPAMTSSRSSRRALATRPRLLLLKALAVGQGERGCRQVALGAEPELLQDGNGVGAGRGDAALPVQGADDDVVEHRKSGEGLHDLEGAAHA